MVKFYKIALVLISLALPSAPLAQDFDAGLRAAKSGDFATALKEWKPLAEQGDAFAQYSLGQMYRNGYAMPQDYSEAVRWYRLAAEQGHADAQTNLGVMYDNGEGVPQDYSEATQWYRLAAEQGNANAQHNLGVMHDAGRGVLQNDIRAHMWYNVSASKGNETAEKNRNLIAAEMTSTDISKAQELAGICLASNYQDCGD